MTVCKCDRCGAYVDKDIIPVIRGKFDPITIRDCKQDFKKDLCYNCYSDLLKFLEPKEETK